MNEPTPNRCDFVLSRSPFKDPESKFQAVIDALPCYIMVMGADGSRLCANRQVLDYHGTTVEQWQAEGFAPRFIHPADLGRIETERQRGLAEARPLRLELRLLGRDRKYRWFLADSTPQFDDHGRIAYWIATLTDIDDRKHAEDALWRSEAYLNEAQRLTHTGSWALDLASGKYEYVSEEDYRIWGFDLQKGPPTRAAVFQRIHPEDRDRWQAKFEKALRERVESSDEYRIVLPDGTIKYIHTIRHPVLNAAGELEKWVGTTVDVTERKRAETALQEARAELERVSRVTTMGALTASIAHEVNQPLAGVVTSANAALNWLAAHPPNLAKTREALERVLRDATRAGEVIARIRALLKRTPPDKTLLSLNPIIRDVLALAASELRASDIETAVALDSNLPSVLGDTVQLQQVMLNLITNAIEAMAEVVKGQRTLRIQSGQGDLGGKRAVVVAVSDTGLGLGDADIERLFEAFHTTKPQGMGMGLWISRSIIEEHGGRLTAQANSGPGATFVLTIPAEPQIVL